MSELQVPVDLERVDHSSISYGYYEMIDQFLKQLLRPVPHLCGINDEAFHAIRRSPLHEFVKSSKSSSSKVERFCYPRHSIELVKLRSCSKSHMVWLHLH